MTITPQTPRPSAAGGAGLVAAPLADACEVEA